MTLLFMDGFDHYTYADLLEKWEIEYDAGNTIVFSSGRRGTNGFRSTGSSYGYFGIGVSDLPTVIAGTALKQTGGLSRATVAFTGIMLIQGVSAQITMTIEENGSIAVKRGGPTGTTICASTAGTFVLGKWYFIELKITIHNTTGVAEVLVNGVSVCSASGVDTQVTGNAYVDQIRFVHYPNYSGWYVHFDDIYVCDDQGGVNDDFLGDVRVDALFPDGAGTSTDWTPSAGSNYDCVNETAPNDDTDYISETTASDHDSYSYGNLATTSGAIYGIQTLPFARKDDAGSRNIKALIRSGGTDYTPGDAHSVGDDYDYHMDIFEQDPNTSAAWTIAGVNATEFGPKLES